MRHKTQKSKRDTNSFFMRAIEEKKECESKKISEQESEYLQQEREQEFESMPGANIEEHKSIVMQFCTTFMIEPYNNY